MTYAFTHMGSFLLLHVRTRPPPASRPISQPGGPYPSLQAQIPVLRPKSHPQGPNPNPKAQIPLSRDLGVKTGIWASRLGYGSPGGDIGWGEGGCGEAEKISHMLPLNFNHNLLKQGTGTADHLTLLRLFFLAVAPQGPMTYAFTYGENFFTSSPSPSPPSAYPPPSLKTQNPV